MSYDMDHETVFKHVNEPFMYEGHQCSSGSKLEVSRSKPEGDFPHTSYDILISQNDQVMVHSFTPKEWDLFCLKVAMANDYIYTPNE
jgi:hypothetical protein